MRILGIDPGIGRTGWGVIEVQSSSIRLRSGQEFKVQGYGCIETKSTTELGERLKQLHLEIEKLLEKHKPDAVGIEELFFNTNSKTAFVVGQARGVVMLAVANRQLPLSIYTPLQVKMAVTGYGRAEKRQVGQMVKTLLKLDIIPKPDDITDALAIALTHAFSYKLKSKV